jgi:hypothetical protein
MDIYTGTCVFNHLVGDDISLAGLISLVPTGFRRPDGQFEIQGYPAPNQNNDPPTTQIISASMTNFGHSAEAAFVDGAVVKMVQRTFQGSPRNVLVIQAEIGAEDGDLHRMAYQVTVLTLVNADTNLSALTFFVDPHQNVPDL